MKVKKILSIDEVNTVPKKNFERMFGNVIEHCPQAASFVAEKRPFESPENLKTAFDDYLEKIETIEKEFILLNHPDLAGKLAEEGQLTAESQNEQKAAGLNTMTKEDKEKLRNFNQLYRGKFRFPFVICARENKVQSILSGIERRLKNDRDTEVNTGINEVKKICRIRIDDILQ